MGYGRSSRSRGTPQSRSRNAGPRRKRRWTPPTAPLGPVRQLPPLDPAGPVPDGFASQRGREIRVGTRPARSHNRRRLLDVWHTLHAGALGNLRWEENPSRVPEGRTGRWRTVSWEECQEFYWTRLKSTGKRSWPPTIALPFRSPVGIRLLARAQTTATYPGPLKIEGVNNPPNLDAIAWYGENSGDDFELNNGYRMLQEWREKQFQFD